MAQFGKTVDRTLRQYPGLKSYFLSEGITLWLLILMILSLKFLLQRNQILDFSVWKIFTLTHWQKFTLSSCFIAIYSLQYVLTEKGSNYFPDTCSTEQLHEETLWKIWIKVIKEANNDTTAVNYTNEDQHPREKIIIHR